MTAPSPRPKRRHRRLVVATMMLAVSAVGMWLLVWTLIQHNWRDAWVAEVERLRVPVEVALDGADNSSIGRLRSWLGVSRATVYLSTESEAKLLLRAPTGEPHGTLV